MEFSLLFVPEVSRNLIFIETSPKKILGSLFMDSSLLFVAHNKQKTSLIEKIDIHCPFLIKGGDCCPHEYVIHFTNGSSRSKQGLCGCFSSAASFHLIFISSCNTPILNTEVTSKVSEFSALLFEKSENFQDHSLQ